jgi:hypothetical protein
MIYARLYVTGEIVAGTLDATASFFLTNDGRAFDARSIELLPEGMITGEITEALRRETEILATFAASCLLSATNHRSCHANHKACDPSTCRDFVPNSQQAVRFNRGCSKCSLDGERCTAGHDRCGGCKDFDPLPF